MSRRFFFSFLTASGKLYINLKIRRQTHTNYTVYDISEIKKIQAQSMTSLLSNEK